MLPFDANEALTALNEELNELLIDVTFAALAENEVATDELNVFNAVAALPL